MLFSRSSSAELVGRIVGSLHGLLSLKFNAVDNISVI
jgi:hypothetical protein